MTDEHVRRLNALDEAERLLAAAKVRGIAGAYRTQMDINRLIIEGARERIEPDSPTASDPLPEGAV